MALRDRLRAEVRMFVVSPEVTYVSEWSQMLIMPVAGYLESWDEPWPVRFVEWVELRAEGPEALMNATELAGVRWCKPAADAGAVRILNPFFQPPQLRGS